MTIFINDPIDDVYSFKTPTDEDEEHHPSDPTDDVL